MGWRCGSDEQVGAKTVTFQAILMKVPVLHTSVTLTAAEVAMELTRSSILKQTTLSDKDELAMKELCLLLVGEYFLY